MHMKIIDQDNDFLEIKEVGGFGQPTLVLLVSQESDVSGININQQQAQQLIDFLQEFVRNNDKF